MREAMHEIPSERAQVTGPEDMFQDQPRLTVLNAEHLTWLLLLIKAVTTQSTASSANPRVKMSATQAFCLILFQQKAKTAHRPTITSPHCDYDLHKCAQACLMPCSREPQPPILFLMNPLRFSRGSLCPWAMHRGVWSTFLPAWWFTT